MCEKLKPTKLYSRFKIIKRRTKFELSYKNDW